MTRIAELARAALAEGAPPQVALMRLLLSGASAAEVRRGLRAGGAELDALAALADRHADGLAALQRVVAAGADHGDAGSPGQAIAAARAMFDRLVGISAEASVAAYSLGDAALLEQSTREVVGWLRGQGLLAGRPRVLDLGCGIGRFAVALAADASAVLALDVAPGMVAAARARCAGLPNVRVEACSGADLRGVADAAFDLVLAVDVFPYLVQGGLAGVAELLAEVARVLAPPGCGVILNFSYRGPDADRRDVAALARACGLALGCAGERPFTTWDGAAWVLRHGGA